MTAAETREERAARRKAAEQAAQELRASLPPISPDAMQVAMGGASTYDDHGHPVCGRCRYGEPVGVLFGVIADGAKLCEQCLDSAGPRGEALALLVEAVEDLDSALAHAPSADRVQLLGAAGVMVTRWLPQRFGLSEAVSSE